MRTTLKETTTQLRNYTWLHVPQQQKRQRPPHQSRARSTPGNRGIPTSRWLVAHIHVVGRRVSFESYVLVSTKLNVVPRGNAE